MAVPSRHSNPQNLIAAERTFFVTSSTSQKRNLLQSDRAAQLFLNVLFGYRAQAKYRVHEFVVMPNHFHLLITVGQTMTVERAVQLVKGGFAYRAARELGIRAPVWQKGFSEVRVFNSEAFAKIAEYIRNNPVTRQLVSRAEAYPYSSASLQFEPDAPPQWLKPCSLCVPIGTPEGVP